jgi:4-azaleucine resistance transporter AzlC
MRAEFLHESFKAYQAPLSQIEQFCVGRREESFVCAGQIRQAAGQMRAGFRAVRRIWYHNAANVDAVKGKTDSLEAIFVQQSAGKIKSAFRAAFPHTIPIFAGFWFLGLTYGIYMNVSGFDFWYPMLMSLTIFAGSMEFVTVDLLLGAFAPVQAFLMTLLINARHLFYGLSMLDRYRGTGMKKLYLIFGMCDESFSINYTAQIPPGVDRGWFYFFVTLLNHFYWVFGATLGGLFGSLLRLNTEGLSFVMTAMFTVIFLEQWLKEKNHVSAVVGLAATLLCRVVFGAESFLLPAMGVILCVLTLLRRPLEGRVCQNDAH